jgi:hypothetical protein
VNEGVREVLVLTNHEILKKRVSARVELTPGLPAITGDRVQFTTSDPEPGHERGGSNSGSGRELS